MKPAILALAFAAATATLLSPARANTPVSPALSDEPAGARLFVVALYAHYPYRRGQRFEPIGRSAPAVFDPAMIALLREMDRVTPKGDAPALDGDPLCDCQDDQGLRTKILLVRRSGPGPAPAMASVDVRIAFAGAPAADSRQLRLELAQVHGQWRVHDIHSKDMPSLRAYLIKSNAEAKAQK